jgi:hypothetical protein
MLKRSGRLVGTTLLAVGVIVGLSASASVQDVTLRYRWAKGDTARYRLTMNSAVTMSGLPGGMGDVTLNTRIAQVLRNDVEDMSGDGAATIRQTFESVRVEIDTPMGKMQYDSAAPESAAGDPGSALVKDMYAGLVGESIVIVMSQSGEVRKVDGMSRLAEKMFAKLPGQAMGPMGDSLKAGLSDDAMKIILSQGFGQLPEKPVKPGDTWNTQMTVPNPMIGGMTTKMASTLKAVDASQMATIVTKVAIAQDTSKPAANPMGFTVQMSEGTGAGEILFDAARGQLQRGTTELTLPMTMSGAAPDGTAINAQTLTRTTVTIELVKPDTMKR